MSSALVLCPTRGRPANAAEVLDSFRRTKALDESHLLFVVDDDDPSRDDYLDLVPATHLAINESIGSMVLALNAQATLHAAIGVYDYLGFVGDDHRFRTEAWDRIMLDKLDAVGGGFGYANDLYQGINLPTQVVMSASIVNELGWMAPPVLRHLWVDDAWKYLGSSVGRLVYFPEVTIEHVHPYAGKAAMDEHYERVNSRQMIDHDREAFGTWLRNSASDVAKVKAALGMT